MTMFNSEPEITPRKLTPTQQARLREAEEQRIDTETDYLSIIGPAIEAYLRLTQRAALRSFTGTGALVAAAEPEPVEDDIYELMLLANLEINPRSEGEPFTSTESAVIWLAVLTALARFRTSAIPPHLQRAMRSSAIPLTAYDLLSKIQSTWSAEGAPVSVLTGQVQEALQLPRTLSQIIGRETRGVLMPETFSPPGKIFEGSVIEIARNAAGSEVGEGRLTELLESGAPRKMWASIWLDDRVRPSHMAAHGQVQDVDETFYVGSTRLMFPCDPQGPIEETANCRCVIIEP